MNSKYAAACGLLLSVGLCAALAACRDELSDVGKQENLLPTAVAGAVGYTTIAANDEIATDVRAGTQLLLTGKDSIEADKPIIGFLWEPANAAAELAAIVVRNTNTIAVNVPSVTQATDMRFKLTVTDSDGDDDATFVTLHVQPRVDSDRFLQYVRNVAKLRLVAGTRQPGAAGAFDLALTGHLTYTTRSGTTNTIHFPIGDVVHGSWPASSQPAADQGALDFRNPLQEFPMPSVDLDRVTRQFQQTLPRSAPDMADPAFVDDASLALTITLTPTSATATATVYVLDTSDAIVAQGSNGGTGAPAVLNLSAAQLDELHISGGGIENEQTAASYYAAIDPTGAKRTLRQWLTENCFDPAAADFGADVHAVYVNNFDLGFGRDMYFRTTRPAGCASTSFENGHIASVVINYPTLEAAAKKIAPVIAVAMEYEAVDADHSAPGRVTFYAFAPDEGTGEFRRVSSANFDGRGEKYLPGACTMCHGGRPRLPQANRALTYATEADTQIGATFMPWDLESFLFSDTDRTFPQDASNATLRESLTRARQEAQFKRLNLAAYSTYGSGAGAGFTCHDLFAGPCELIELWYGGAGVPSGTFRDRQVAAGWIAGGANPATAADLYLDVYARNCRSCHAQRVFALNATSDPQFRNYAEFTRTAAPAWRNLIVEQVFQVAGMPAARLTMDRFWTRHDGATQSAGEILAQHLGIAAGIRPGAPTACFTATPGLGDTATTRAMIDRHDEIIVDAACSQFASSVRWQLAVPGGSSTSLVANANTRTSFTPDKSGDFDLTLRVTGPAGDIATLTRYAHVDNLVPQARDIQSSIDLNVATPVDVLTGTPLGDPPVTVTIVSASAGLTASVDGNQRVVITPTTVQGGSVVYRITDVDGGDDNSDTGTITVTVNASITANDVSDSVAANSANNDITLNIAAQSQPVIVTPTAATATPRGGSFVIVACGNGYCARYTPPAAIITVFGSVRTGAADTFEYSACFAAQQATCDTATITVDITGSAPFAPVATILRGVCTGCHVSTPPIGASWSLPSATATDKQAWCAVRFQNGVDEPVGSPPLVNPGNPEASLLYRKPQPLDGHAGPYVNASEAAAILAWIREGGAFTSGASQTCP